MPSNRTKLIYKIIMFVCVMIAFGVGVYLAIVLFSGMDMNPFSQHFALPICLICVAVVAFLLPLATKTKFGGDDAKDNLMLIVAAILFLLGIASCIFSYMNLSF